MGKRYAGAARGIELLCIKVGEGSLAVGAVMPSRRDAQPLPASD